MNGVAEFTLNGIKPLGAADSPAAFPAWLDFNEEYADFNMTPSPRRTWRW